MKTNTATAATKKTGTSKVDQLRARREAAAVAPPVTIEAEEAATAAAEAAADEADLAEAAAKYGPDGETSASSDAPAPAASGPKTGKQPDGVRRYFAAARERGPARTIAIHLREAGEKIAYWGKMAQSWAPHEDHPGVDAEAVQKGRDAIAAVVAACDANAAVLESIFPEGWKPGAPPKTPRAAAGAPVDFTPGLLVEVKPAARAAYADLLEESDLSGLTVLTSSNGKVKVKNGNGVPLLFPRKDLSVVSPALAGPREAPRDVLGGLR
jgi:hypothetical protein